MEYIDQYLGSDFSVIATRLLIALALSGIIGFEREMNNHSAGFRTHILVGVGSCLMMLMSIYGFVSFMDSYDNVRFDPARIPSYVISGIGFLGAGTIIVYGGTIRGLTTAASIWTVAGLGLIVGIGMYSAAVLATLIILVSLAVLNSFEKIFPKVRSFYDIELRVTNDVKVFHIAALLEEYEVKIRNVEVSKMDGNLRTIHVKVGPDRNFRTAELFDELSKMEGVNYISDLKN
ncbi:MgtC/SapB family protein [Oceanobacillus halophilus]|uniref:MgtC/SapB family protein n=1 Tax=Oceanobacillus halophilus TaxID=930130 RepID=A0A494ZZL0_9BACI|nr:MgtC/SapB family protein [Oceanobacillus halophilus]RKQ32375.1 MgtC/SapB family protein [Oceanobacillus halophilus]